MRNTNRENRGGVRTLKGLKNRCSIDEVTGCWNWLGGGRRLRNGAIDPRVWLATEDRSTTLQQAAWKLAGKPLDAEGNVPPMIWRRCRNTACGNPEHLEGGTRAAWGEWLRTSGHLGGTPERSISAYRARMKQTSLVLSEELAEWIRESSQTGRVIAAALDCSESMVSRVRRNEAWTFSARNVHPFLVRA